jgi:hypothetical protein
VATDPALFTLAIAAEKKVKKRRKIPDGSHG